MYKSRSRKTRVSTKNPEKNQRNRSHKATRKQSAAGNNTLKGNQGTPIRNESEPSSTYFLAESSDKDISAQYLRPNIHPIYHLRGWTAETFMGSRLHAPVETVEKP